MRNIIDIINESSKTTEITDLPKGVKNILESDPRAAAVLHRTEKYDANKLETAQAPKFLLQHTDDSGAKKLSWITPENLDEDEAKNVIGIYINRMYYPLLKSSTIESLLEHLKDND